MIDFNLEMRLFVSLLACFTYVTGNSVAPNKWCDGSKGEAGGTAKEYARGCVVFDKDTKKLTFRNELPECLGPARCSCSFSFSPHKLI